MNSVSLIGRLTRDPDLRYIPSGTPISRFTLAVDRGLSKDKKQELQSEGKPTADFINILVWGKTAENCANFLGKGRLAAVQGRIQTGSYMANDGTKRYTTEVVAQNVQFLEWGDKDPVEDYHFDGMEGFTPTDNDDIPF